MTMSDSVNRRISGDLDKVMDDMMEEFNEIFGFKPSKTEVGSIIAEKVRKKGLKSFLWD